MASKLPENLNAVPALNMLKVFLNFGNLIFLSPFTIHYDGYLQGFKTKRSATWRRVLTGTIHLACMGLRVVQMIFKDKIIFSAWNSALLSATTTLIRISIIYMLWCQHNQIANIMTAVNAFYNKRISDRNQINVYKSKLASYGVVWILLLGLLLDWMRLVQYTNRSFPNFVVKGARFYFLRQSNYTIINEDGYACMDYIWGSIYSVLTSAERILYNFGTMATIMATIAIWRATCDYINMLKQKRHGNGVNFPEVLLTIAEIHELVNKCSDCFGFIYCQLCVCLIPLYATHLNFFTRGRLMQQVSIVYNLAGVLLVVLPAANTNHKVKSLLPWMRSISLETDHERSTDQNTNHNNYYSFGGSILIQEIQHDGFAFSGIFFRITYGLIGNVFTLMVTYVMIILQLREK